MVRKGRSGVFALILAVALGGCAPALTNLAAPHLGAELPDARMGDGDPQTVAETARNVDSREFIVRLPGVSTVRRVQLSNHNLADFEISVWDVDRREWRSKQRVKPLNGERDTTVGGLNLRTDVVKLTVYEAEGDRLVNEKHANEGDKVVGRHREYFNGIWIEWVRIKVEEPARIGELRVFGSPVGGN